MDIDDASVLKYFKSWVKTASEPAPDVEMGGSYVHNLLQEAGGKDIVVQTNGKMDVTFGPNRYFGLQVAPSFDNDSAPIVIKYDGFKYSSSHTFEKEKQCVEGHVLDEFSYNFDGNCLCGAKVKR